MRLRAPRADEAQAVLDLLIAYDIATIGRPDYTLDDVHGDWALPDLDLDADVLVVEDDDGALKAVISANTAAVEHLRRAGWERVQVYQHMRADLRESHVPPPPTAPVRCFDLAAEGPAVHALIETAFSENTLNTSQSYANWHAEVSARCDPAFRLALDDDGLVGGAVGERREDGVGYVAQLAVAARARGRGHGHGRALLSAMLDAFRAAGLAFAELSVAGANAPARRLYESVGMVPDFAAERWQLR